MGIAYSEGFREMVFFGAGWLHGHWIGQLGDWLMTCKINSSIVPKDG